MSRILRVLPLVVVPLLLIASAFPGQFEVSTTFWILAMSSAAAFCVGARAPVPVSLVISALAVPMFASQAWGLSELVPYLGAFALADVVARSPRTPSILLASAGWTASVVLGAWLDDHSSFWTLTTMISVVALVALPLSTGFYFRAQRALAESYRLRAEEAEARRLDAEQRTRVAERSAVARELHDLVAHHMASIVLRIGVARHVLGDVDEAVQNVLDDVHSTASDSLADIRRLLVALRDPGLSAVTLIDSDSVVTEIDAAVERTRSAGFPVDSRIDTEIGDLDAIGRLTVVRVVQESLTNVMKHAVPESTVEVDVARADRGFRIMVVNDAAPATPTDYGRTQDRHGLIGMNERVHVVNGTFDAQTTNGKWTVTVWIPGRTNTPDTTAPVSAG